MNLSSGDWVAIVIGAGASMRWVVDIAKSWVGDRRHEDKADEQELAQLKSDFRSHLAEDRVMNEWLKEAINNLSQGLNQLQSQVMRFVATAPNNRIYELDKRDKGAGGS